MVTIFIFCSINEQQEDISVAEFAVFHSSLGYMQGKAQTTNDSSDESLWFGKEWPRCLNVFEYTDMSLFICFIYFATQKENIV